MRPSPKSGKRVLPPATSPDRFAAVKVSGRRHPLAYAAALALAAATALAILLAGCGGEASRSFPAVTPETVTRPARIISMAPSITEMLFAIGAADQVVAVTEYCKYPPEAQAKPKVGAYLNPDLETLVALRPDLVILAREHRAVIDHCKHLGILTLELSMLGLEDIFENIEAAGEASGHRREAAALAARLRADLDATRESVAAFPKMRTLLVLGSSGPELQNLMTVGNTSFLAELIPYAGGDNVFADIETPYFNPSKEQILARAPQVIVETVGEGVQGDASNPRSTDVLAGWRKLISLPAVRDGRVVRVTGSHLHIPGPRVAETARELARAIHPEAPVVAPAAGAAK